MPFIIIRSRVLRIFPILFLSFITFASHGQLMKTKFGKVLPEEMKMTVYEKDTTANAVYLYDIGHFSGNDFRFTRKIRIKILDKEGTQFGNITLRTPNKSSFKAVVSNIENGELIQEKMKKSDVFEDEIIEDVVLYKLFLPNVKVGSVIDLEYSFVGLPMEWRFQKLVPVKYSELQVDNNQYIDFTVRQYGFTSLEIPESNHWIARDVPAFTEEPYLSHYSNYLTKIEFEISRINFPGLLYREYATSWEKVTDRLLESSRFGEPLNQMGFLNEKAREIKSMDISREEKIKIAYDYIRGNITWNGEKSVYCSREYRNNFTKEHNGNSADVNLMLIALLNKAEINTFPVVLSTRDNGLLMPFFVSLDKLNYVVAGTYIENEFVLFDATSKDLSIGILPNYCLNGQGWVVEKDGGTWVELLGDNKKNEKVFTNISFDEDGWIADVQKSNAGYSYLSWKEEQNSFDTEEKFAKHMEDVYENLIFENYEIIKDETDNQYSSEKMTINLDDHIDDLGNEVIINPLIFYTSESNPFKSEERKYPVDLTTPLDLQTSVMLAIPDGWSIKTMPESVSIALPNKEGVFRYHCVKTNSNNVQLVLHLKIKKTIFSEQEYAALRNFYSIIMDKTNESIALSKKS